jgi:hypothetical protein
MRDPEVANRARWFTLQCSPPQKAAARFLPPLHSALGLRPARGMEGGGRGVRASAARPEPVQTTGAS